MKPEKARAWISALGGRRFLLAVGSGLVTALLTAAAKISDATYATVVIATIGVYIGGNVTQKVKAKTQEEADA